MRIELSVIVLNYNVASFLELCLHSVQKAIQNIKAEIIIADNNSTDESLSMVRQYFPDLILIANSENLGFSKAYNQAVKKAKGEYICILNPDTVVQESTFVSCLIKAKTLPELGIMGVQLIDGRGNFLPESKRNLPTPKVSFLKFFGKRFSNIAPYYADHIKNDEEGAVSILAGAFMLVKKEVYQKTGGFDERYFMYGEDIDFSYSVSQLGYQNYYLGTESVVHFKGESTTKNKVYRERFYGAMKLFYKKYFKHSWLTDFIISAGIKVFSILGKAKNESLQITFNSFIYVGESPVLKEKILLKNPQIYKNENQDKNNLGNNLCLLDTRSTSYRELLGHLKPKPNMFFRFILPFSNKCIGSDTSSGRGEVVSF